MNERKDLFFCYEKEKCDFLLEKGFKFITKARHHKTYKLFTLWRITKEFDKAVKEYDSI
jgi:hypothetical protein